jgi:hypothetical protein
MSPKVAQIANLFMSLNASEKAEILQFIRPVQGLPGRGETIANEEFGKSQTINFAPGPKVCPRCGR